MSLAVELAVMLGEATGALRNLDADRLESLLAAAPNAAAGPLGTEEELAALNAARNLYGLLMETTAAQLRTLQRVCPTGEDAWRRSQA